MSKQPLIILFVVIITLIVVVGVVQAFTMDNVDGQWSCIEPIDGGCGLATNKRWATGPESGSTNFDDPVHVLLIWGDQSWPDYYDDDWNQVRYGEPTGTEVGFAGQSGFGFDGVDDVMDPSTPNFDTPFLLGKFCHFNNPIDAEDEMDWVDLFFRVENVQCDPFADSLSPDPDNILDFTYRFTLDETPNNPMGDECIGGYSLCPHTLGEDTQCPYQSGVNSLGCADRVDIGALPLEDSFTCYYDGSPKQYKIGVLGFAPLPDSLQQCPEVPSGEFSYSLISPEEADNCACLYGIVTEVTGTAVELINFSASKVEDGVELNWETVTEVDNLGFNLYRSQSLTDNKEQLNEIMIPCQVIGSLFGAQYSYVDKDLLIDGTYYYWLESVDIRGFAELHGPVEVHR
jgi:hypothetical protein